MDIHGVLLSGVLLPLGLGLLFAFSNGFRDSSTIVATIVSSGVLSPNYAFFLCAVFEFGGALLLGSAVASTIGSGVIGGNLHGSGKEIVLVLETGLGSAFLWGIVSWWRAWPTSNNQALVAGLSGASLAVWGTDHFQNKIVFVVILVLILSPIIGFVFSAVFTSLLRAAGAWMTPKMKKITDGLHLLACLIASSAHGSNDGQMVMGVLMTVLGGVHVLGATSGSEIPIVLRFYVALAIAAGVLLGGRRIAKKMGMKFYRIRPPQGVGSQMTSAGTILACTLSGFPASTTQVITGSIVGAGVAKSPRAVRWHIVQEIILSWILTLPTVGVLAFVLSKVLLRIS